jgi:hypothetical protein
LDFENKKGLTQSQIALLHSEHGPRPIAEFLV